MPLAKTNTFGFLKPNEPQQPFHFVNRRQVSIQLVRSDW
jgi:hypothetical protein